VIDTAALVLPLQAVGRGDLAVAGGKGANLGELVRAGFPVPPGFVVTTAAYDQFVAANHLGDAIAAAPTNGDGAGLRAAFEAGTIPAEIEHAIRAGYDALGWGAVAVRSSATAEDLPEAAFAGQQDTYLNVVGAEALRDAVRRCWASLWTDRAIAYRARQGLDLAEVRLAVVVQRMVAADAAGVLFTANPVTGARDETVVDASPGLGEAVVSGLVTPDHAVLRKQWWGWSIGERRAGQREVVIRARRGGGTEHLTGFASAGRTLPDRALRGLARLGEAIECHFGVPQDVEWAWASGRLFIVQARPITVLPEPALPVSRLLRMWIGNIGELIPIRPYPFEVDPWGPAAFAAISPVANTLGIATRADAFFEEEDGVAVRINRTPPIHPGPGIALAPLRVGRLARRYDSTRWQDDPGLVATLALAHDLGTRDLPSLSYAELLATLREALTIPQRMGEVRVRQFPRAALATGALALWLRLLGHGDRFGAITSGVVTKTIEANRALEALAARIRAEPALAEAFASHDAADLWEALGTQPAGQAFLDELRAFLVSYGNREAFIFGVAHPTWGDAPEVVLGILKGLAAAPPRADLERPTWEAARDAMLAHPLLRLPRPRAAFIGILEQARRLVEIRENTHFYATLAMPIVRHTTLEVGRRLVDAGALTAPDDVFHLQLGELERMGRSWPPSRPHADELRAVVARRVTRRAALEGTPLIDPRLQPRVEVARDVLLRGAAGSAGVVTGRVCIVRDGSEFGKLRPGQVLVAPFTNPSWTPLFQHAAAVVVDTGAAGSHAAIVAREYRIPAVMGVVDGTRRLVDGQLVRVNGDRGLVLRAEP
jgi:pyruvate,water dikinase